MDRINFGHYVLPILSGIEIDGQKKLKDFLGAAFLVDEKGGLLTCKHVIDSVDEDCFPFVQYIKTGEFFRINSVKYHEKYDIAYLETNIQPSEHLELDSDFTGLGRPVKCFGFSFEEKKGSDIRVNARLESGHVLGIREVSQANGANVLELNFAVTNGFSGGALFNEDYGSAVGMVFGNIESRFQAYSYEDVEDGNVRHRHTVDRVVEYGLAFPSTTLADFIAQFK